MSTGGAPGPSPFLLNTSLGYRRETSGKEKINSERGERVKLKMLLHESCVCQKMTVFSRWLTDEIESVCLTVKSVDPNKKKEVSIRTRNIRGRKTLRTHTAAAAVAISHTRCDHYANYLLTF